MAISSQGNALMNRQLQNGPRFPGGGRREEQVLIRCAKTGLTPAERQEIADRIRQGVDWDLLMANAMRHRLMPALYHNLKAISAATPPEVLAQLREFFNLNARRSLFLTHELTRLLSLMQSQGIQAIPFKGPVLATYAYSNLAFRQFDDLDILVPKSQVLRARQLLEQKGFRDRIERDGQQLEQQLRSGFAFTLEREDGLVTVDLHWTFNAPGFSFRFEADSVWEQLSSVTMLGKPVKVLPLETTLLLHCVHGAKHEWERLEWIAVLNEMIRARPELDWEWVFEQAERLGGQRMLLLGLKLASDLFGNALPSRVLLRIREAPMIGQLAAEVRRGLFDHSNPEVREAGRFAFHLKAREHWRDKGRLLVYVLGSKLAPNRRDRERIPLPPFLSFSYYLTRPLRLMREYGLEPFAQFLRRLRVI